MLFCWGLLKLSQTRSNVFLKSSKGKLILRSIPATKHTMLEPNELTARWKFANVIESTLS